MIEIKPLAEWLHDLRNYTTPQEMAETLRFKEKPMKKRNRRVVRISKGVQGRVNEIFHHIPDQLEEYMKGMQPSDRDVFEVMYVEGALPTLEQISPPAFNLIRELITETHADLVYIDEEVDPADRREKSAGVSKSMYEKYNELAGLFLSGRQNKVLFNMLWTRLIVLYSGKIIESPILNDDEGLREMIQESIEVYFSRN